MRRRERSTNIFGLITKSIYESTAGRIRWQRNMWAVVGSQWDRRRVTNSFLDELVRGDHVLVRKSCTHCPCPPGDDFHLDDKKRWWSVPATECRKCQYHRPSQRGGFRFPRCTYQKPKSMGDIAASTLVQVANLVGEAERNAEDIVRGRA